LLDEGQVFLEGHKVSTAPQDQGLIDSRLEYVVALLNHDVFIGFASVDAGIFQAEVVQKGLVALGRLALSLQIVRRRGASGCRATDRAASACRYSPMT